MKTKLAIAVGMVALLLGVSTAEAQWLNYPTPGIPRLPDGSPDLEAPVPLTADGTPDLSGIWITPTVRYLFNLAADTKYVWSRGPTSCTGSVWRTRAGTAPALDASRTA